MGGPRGCPRHGEATSTFLAGDSDKCSQIPRANESKYHKQSVKSTLTTQGLDNSNTDLSTHLEYESPLETPHVFQNKPSERCPVGGPTKSDLRGSNTPIGAPSHSMISPIICSPRFSVTAGRAPPSGLRGHDRNHRGSRPKACVTFGEKRFGSVWRHSCSFRE